MPPFLRNWDFGFEASLLQSKFNKTAKGKCKQMQFFTILAQTHTHHNYVCKYKYIHNYFYESEII